MLNPLSGKYTIRYDESEFCYVVEAVDVLNRTQDILSLNVPKVLRLMIKKMSLNYRQVAEFCNLDRSNKVFRMAYTNHLANTQLEDIARLNHFFTIDTATGTAKFYHHDHQPASIPDTHVAPIIHCTEDNNLEIIERIPTKVTTRVVIEDPISRMLTMTLSPTNGYLLGVNDLNLCSPNSVYVINGAAAVLNDLLRRIHFVGVTAGTGKVEIKVNDNEGKDTSEAIANVTLTITEGEKISIPKINVPDTEIAAPLHTDTKISPAITVGDDDGKLISLRIYPYNCEVYGWKSYPGVIGYGQNRVTIGRPEVVNEDIANLSVRTQAANAQLGLELICGKVMLRDYVLFNTESDDDDSDDEPENPESVVPELTVGNVTGKASDEVALNASFSTEGVTDPVALVITPTNCSIKNYGTETIAAGEANTDTADVVTINNKLKAAKVVVGDRAGSIMFAWQEGKQTKTITVSVIAESAVPKLTAMKALGATGSAVAMNAVFSTEGVTADQVVTLTPTGCLLSGIGDAEQSSDPIRLEGPIADINAVLKSVKIIIGSGNGKVLFTWNNGKSSKELPVEVQQVTPVALSAKARSNTTSKPKVATK